MEDPYQRLVFNRMFAGMRHATLTMPFRGRHDVNGFYNRGCPDAHPYVIELAGSNHHLRCTECGQRPQEPTSDFQREIELIGTSKCPRYIYTETTSPTTKQEQKPTGRKNCTGSLMPDIIHSDKQIQLWEVKNQVQRHKTADVTCHVLLVLAAGFESETTTSVLKMLADEVHKAGGIVISVGWRTPPLNKWAGYIDLHIESDVDRWSHDLLGKSTFVKKYRPKVIVAERFQRLAVRTRQRNGTTEMEYGAEPLLWGPRVTFAE
ncbi:hypothetical protein FRC12_018526 [Ceratobasidium sp. 428]|nr:hypothetical protein FRC12_018526 [Ceratobasidium sp. 428]